MNVDLDTLMKVATGAITALIAVAGVAYKFVRGEIRKEISEHELRESAQLNAFSDRAEKRFDEVSERIAKLDTHVSETYATKQSLDNIGERFDKRFESIDTKLDRLLERLLRP